LLTELSREPQGFSDLSPKHSAGVHVGLMLIDIWADSPLLSLARSSGRSGGALF
jgi:hypothetical protein